MSDAHTRYDVVIGGGGLAGLTLGRQLSMYAPQLSIAIVDRLSRPLPEAAFKVGESTVEIGAHYYGAVLKLSSYLAERHLPKFGLRYFMGSGALPLNERSEFGPDGALPTPTYQLDRGRLENDLRQMIVDAGVTLYEGHDLADVRIDADEDHVVSIVRVSDRAPRTLRCRWFVDASGRRRLLHSKFKLSKESPHKASGAWFRMDGRLDVEDLVGPEHTEWHQRVPHRMRYLSTNHLTSTGYWVWLIPLSSGATSIGIVTDERIHPCHTYSSPDKALRWLADHEPHLAEYLRGRPFVDFKALRHYSYLTTHAYSVDRWACVGEAAAFIDPLVSPGSDMIAIGNLITQELITRDFRGALTPSIVSGFDRFFCGFVETFLIGYTGRYPLLGTPRVFREKFLWDACTYWAWPARLVCGGLITRHDLLPQLVSRGAAFSRLHARVQDLFSDWAAAKPGVTDFDFVPPNAIPYIKHLQADLLRERSPEQWLASIAYDFDRFEELAIHLFFTALGEVHPHLLARFDEPRWVNAWAIGLDPARWRADGLFHPPTPPRSLEPIAAITSAPRRRDRHEDRRSASPHASAAQL